MYKLSPQNTQDKRERREHVMADETRHNRLDAPHRNTHISCVELPNAVTHESIHQVREYSEQALVWSHISGSQKGVNPFRTVLLVWGNIARNLSRVRIIPSCTARFYASLLWFVGWTDGLNAPDTFPYRLIGMNPSRPPSIHLQTITSKKKIAAAIAVRTKRSLT